MNPTYTEIQALQASADAARSAKLDELLALIRLAAATTDLLEEILNIVLGTRGVDEHTSHSSAAHREQLEPLANSLGFSLQPSPIYVGRFILVPWSKS